MSKKYQLSRSNRKNKKWQVTLPSGIIVHFGDSRYEDYTMHKDEDRKERYLARHSKDYVNDPHYPGFWSRWVLWNTPDLKESFEEACYLANHYGGSE